MEWRRKANGSWGNLPQPRSQDPFSRRPHTGLSRRPHTGLWWDTLNKHCHRESNFQKLADPLCLQWNQWFIWNPDKAFRKWIHISSRRENGWGLEPVWAEACMVWCLTLSLHGLLRGSYFSNPAMLLQLFFQILRLTLQSGLHAEPSLNRYLRGYCFLTRISW